MLKNLETFIPGVITLFLGIGVIYFTAIWLPAGAVPSEVRLVLYMAGAGMVTGGIGNAKARANATSEKAHDDSLAGIAETKRLVELAERENQRQRLDAIALLESKIAEAKRLAAENHATNRAHIEALQELGPQITDDAVQAAVKRVVPAVLEPVIKEVVKEELNR